MRYEQRRSGVTANQPIAGLPALRVWAALYFGLNSVSHLSPDHLLVDEVTAAILALRLATEGPLGAS